jgi:hypothetical protein
MRIPTRTAASIALTAALVMFAAVPAGAVRVGQGEGCTPGFWKNHLSAWEEHTPDQTLEQFFTIPDELASFRTMTFHQALHGGGGRGPGGAAKILFRAAVAAFLNAAHEDIGYPYRRFTEPFDIQLKVNQAVASLDRAAMLDLAEQLDDVNNGACPL